MKPQGIVRKVDGLGRIVLPIELRRQYNLMSGDSAEIIGTDDGILIKPYKLGCVFCDSIDCVESHEGQQICKFHRDFFKSLSSKKYEKEDK